MNIYTIKTEDNNDEFDACADEVTCEEGQLLLFIVQPRLIQPRSNFSFPQAQAGGTIQHYNEPSTPTITRLLCGQFNNVEYFYINGEVDV